MCQVETRTSNCWHCVLRIIFGPAHTRLLEITENHRLSIAYLDMVWHPPTSPLPGGWANIERVVTDSANEPSFI